MEDRFYYTLKQKLYILDLVKSDRIWRLYAEFPKVTQKQIDHWISQEMEMRALPQQKQVSKYTLHKGPSIKYKDLYGFLYQTVKEMRVERLAVTVDLLIRIACAECPEVLELSDKGRTSLIRRFMDFFGLSIRCTTGTSGFRQEQATDDQLANCEAFRRRFKQIIVQKMIPIQSVFNMDQTGINYENPPSRTIDFAGSREVPVQTRNGEKKRLTLFTLFNAAGTLFRQMAIMKGVPRGRVHGEVSECDDITTLHYCQENAWCSQLALEEWHEQIWRPIAESQPGPKLLVLDSYPLHLDATALLSRFDTTVLFVPTGLTFALQPLDCGFFKVFKDELKKLWVLDDDFHPRTEADRRARIITQVKGCWQLMAGKDLGVYWDKSQLQYPFEDIEYVQRQVLATVSDQDDLQNSPVMIQDTNNASPLQTQDMMDEEVSEVTNSQLSLIQDSEMIDESEESQSSWTLSSQTSFHSQMSTII